MFGLISTIIALVAALALITFALILSIRQIAYDAKGKRNDYVKITLKVMSFFFVVLAIASLVIGILTWIDDYNTAWDAWKKAFDAINDGTQVEAATALAALEPELGAMTMDNITMFMAPAVLCILISAFQACYKCDGKDTKKVILVGDTTEKAPAEVVLVGDTTEKVPAQVILVGDTTEKTPVEVVIVDDTTEKLPCDVVLVADKTAKPVTPVNVKVTISEDAKKVEKVELLEEKKEEPQAAPEAPKGPIFANEYVNY